MKKVVFIMLLFVSFIKADTLEKIGDTLLVLIPTLTFGYSYYKDDNEGQIQLAKSLLSTTLSTYALKYAVKEQRPNKENDRSFPSGHTAFTMSSAVYLHKRYDLVTALPAYIGSIFTGYTRVESDNHYTHDVLAGALIGATCSYYFTTKFQGYDLTPQVSANSIGMRFGKKW